MRGSVTLDQAYMMSYEEREIISSIVKDNLEATKKSGLPFF
jgi:DNA invertase Pin-like site-specific DNA recombinase